MLPRYPSGGPYKRTTEDPGWCQCTDALCTRLQHPLHSQGTRDSPLGFQSCCNPRLLLDIPGSLPPHPQPPQHPDPYSSLAQHFCSPCPLHRLGLLIRHGNKTIKSSRKMQTFASLFSDVWDQRSGTLKAEGICACCGNMYSQKPLLNSLVTESLNCHRLPHHSGRSGSAGKPPVCNASCPDPSEPL